MLQLRSPQTSPPLTRSRILTSLGTWHRKRYMCGQYQVMMSGSKYAGMERIELRDTFHPTTMAINGPNYWSFPWVNSAETAIK